MSMMDGRGRWMDRRREAWVAGRRKVHRGRKKKPSAGVAAKDGLPTCVHSCSRCLSFPRLLACFSLDAHLPTYSELTGPPHPMKNL